VKRIQHLAGISGLPNGKWLIGMQTQQQRVVAYNLVSQQVYPLLNSPSFLQYGEYASGKRFFKVDHEGIYCVDKDYGYPSWLYFPEPVTIKMLPEICSKRTVFREPKDR
jgi:hypothetical protein